MKRFVPCLILMAAVLTLLPAPAARAQDSRPIQLSLVPSVQLFDRSTDVAGLRLAIVGENRNVTGIDVGFGLLTKGDFAGVSWGLVNLVDGSTQGLQWSLVNYTKGDVAGLQWGWYNQAGPMVGIQWGIANVAGGEFTGWQAGGLNLDQSGLTHGFCLGLVNVTDQMKGFQLGLVNVTNSMVSGLQIGIVNIIKDKEKLPVLPLVNWRF